MADKPQFQSEKSILGLKPRTTASGSEKIKNWNEEIKKAALFSARTTRKTYLEEVQKRLAEVASRDMNPVMAVFHLKATLAGMGYTPQAGFPGDIAKWHGATIPPAKPGSITDLASTRRLNLIIDTNIKQAQSMGQMSTSDNPVFLMTNPAWELTRVGSRKKPRKDWRDRWNKAGQSVGWKGALKTSFAALKDSPIWAALGDGKGGYRDTLGSEYPPYAFGSGMGWVNVGRKDWKARCEKEGVPDQLESITEKARALKRAQEAAGGKGAYGESADQDWKRKEREEAVMAPPEPMKPVFHPDVTALDPVKEGITGLKTRAAEVKEIWAGKKVRVEETWKKLQEMVQNWPEVDFSGSVIECGNIRQDVDGGMVGMVKVEGDVVQFAAAVESVPVPADADGQAAFDLRAKELAEEMAAYEGRMEGSRKDTEAVDEALERVLEEARRQLQKWKTEECGKIMDACRPAMDALKDDDFEKIKAEFAEVKKQLKRLRAA